MTRDTDQRLYEFGGFCVDVVQRRLSGPDGAALSISSRAFDLLLFLLERPGVLLDKTTLMSHVWGSSIVEEGNLTHCVFELRRAFGETAFENRFIVTVPRRGYQFVARVRVMTGESHGSRAITLVTAPHQLANPERDSPDRSKPRFRASTIVLAALAFLACGSALWLMTQKREIAEVPPVAVAGSVTLAVLPFTDLSPARDMDYLAEEISRELIAEFEMVESLRVVGRVSAFQPGTRVQDPVSICKKLKAQSVLVGSVSKDAGRIRISVSLISARNGSRLWAQDFDGSQRGLPELPQAIALQVARTLVPGKEGNVRALLAPAGDSARTRDADAFAAYLRGVYLFRKRDLQDMPLARDALLRAVGLDPQFAMAHAYLARNYGLMADMGAGDSEQLRSLAYASLERAVQLDPQIADLWWIKARFAFSSSTPFTIRARDLEKAVAASPDDPELLINLADVYRKLGRHAEVLQLADRAYHADPLWTNGVGEFAVVSYDVKLDRTRLLSLADELESIAPTDAGVPWIRARLAFVEGRALDWDRWVARAVELAPRDLMIQGFLSLDYAELGELDAALYHARMGGKVELPDNGAADYNTAHALMVTGNLAAARRVVQDSVARRPNDMFARLAFAELQYFEGDCAGAIDSFVRARPGLGQPPPSLNMFSDPNVVPMLAWCLRATGKAGRATELARAFDIQVAPIYKLSHSPAQGLRPRLAAALGDRRSLIILLRELYGSGSMAFAFVRHEPMIRPYLSDPDVIALLDKLDARRAAWRQMLPKSSTHVPISPARMHE